MDRVAPRMAAVLGTALLISFTAAPALAKKPHPRHKPAPRQKPVLAAKPGTPDRTLAGNGFSTAAVGDWVAADAAVVQPDGRIVTAGEAQLGAAKVIVSTRMLRDGQLDPSYGRGGVVTVDVRGSAGGNALALQRDGKIVIAGTGKTVGGLAFAAVRLLADGSRDASFGHDGVSTVNMGWEAIANSVAIQPDGKIVLGGTSWTSQNEFTAMRLNRDGSLDRSFGLAGIARVGTAGAAWGMVLQPDGKILLAGQSNAPLTRNVLGNLVGMLNRTQSDLVARLLPSGAPDPAFGRGGFLAIPIGQYAIGNAVALQPDGKIVIAGSAFTNTIVSATVRLLPDGSFDRSFGLAGIETIPLLQAVNAVTLQRDGKLVLAATGATALRLNPDGSPDRTFGNGGIDALTLGSAGAANGVTTQPDGKIVLSGCATIAGRLVLSVIRLVG